MNLSETTEMMNNSDYKERFKAEYYQIKIRICGLQNMLYRWDSEQLGFMPMCPRSVYDMQLKAMMEYKAILEIRALLEGIEIDTTLEIA